MYISLYNQSNYTILSSLLKIDDIINHALENNLPGIAITDENMYGTMEFIKKCNMHNIKPIIGLKINSENIVLYAKNYNGYKNLIKLSTQQSYKNISIDELRKYNKDLVAVLPYDSKDKYNILNEIYDDCYLGYKNIDEEKELQFISKNIVFFKKSLYPTKKDRNLLEYLYRIRDGKNILEEINYDIDNYELNTQNLNDLTHEEGLKNTFEILDKCNIEFPTPENYLPNYDCENPKQYLQDLCIKGLNRRLNNQVDEKYKKRLQYELNVINNMGFANYFLVVYDFIKFAKKNNILVGPGRGSAAGSLVAYTLGITEIDPMKYDLLFERFLNPERKTMPDIDTDFPNDKRDIVVKYVQEKYGEKRVSGIITFGTLAPKQVIRDVSRVLNIPLYKVDSLCKFIPQTSKDRLEDLYKNNEAFRVRIESDTILENMYKIALRFEGFPRHTSQHAAGIIMSKVDLDEIIPLVKNEDLYLTGYSMEYLEELGLLKMDFLVLKNLTMIDNILNDIKKTYNRELNFNKIPLDDEKTLSIFKTGNTSGIFQFESTGMKNFLKKLEPSSFEDIFAAIALFRPGAAVNIDSYIKRKKQEEKVEYLDNSLETITKSTYGILIYQEQIMQVANIFAGYSLGEADILRRAMSKKKIELLKAEEEKFIQKSIANGHTYEKAKMIFDLILNFAGYGFNKSHSVVYSIIAYKMAYLKYYFKEIFFSNLLSNSIGSENKTNEYIMEAKLNGIEIIKPTISTSESTYTIQENKIIFPITNIKGIGAVVTEQIKAARKNKTFEDIYDCISRLYIEGLGKKTIETLIYADVFREFGYNRKTLIYNIDSLLNYAELTKDIDPSLVMKPSIEIQNEFQQQELLEQEREVFGFYLTSHPVSLYKQNNKYCISLNEVQNNFGKKIDTIALIENVKVINTKKGDKMAFVMGSDETTNQEFTLFPKVFEQCENIKKGDIIKVRGTIEKRLNEYQIIVDKIKIFEGESNEK